MIKRICYMLYDDTADPKNYWVFGERVKADNLPSEAARIRLYQRTVDGILRWGFSKRITLREGRVDRSFLHLNIPEVKVEDDGSYIFTSLMVPENRLVGFPDELPSGSVGILFPAFAPIAIFQSEIDRRLSFEGLNYLERKFGGNLSAILKEN